MDKSFINRTIGLRGKDRGTKWLESIPGLISEFEEKWSFKINGSYPLSINYVAPVLLNDGAKAVFKIGYPEDREFLSEVEALRLLNGETVVKLLAEDLKKRAILIEQLTPGTPLSCLEDDEKATRIIAHLMNEMWRVDPKNNNFIDLKNWASEFQLFYKTNSSSSQIPVEAVKEAEKIFKDLTSNPNGLYLVHGDLHHDNVLSAQREPWLAIDHMGIIAEREYDVAALLRNPYKKLEKMDNIKDVLNRRLDILEDVLGFERQRIIKWGFAQTILSVVWNIESKNQRWKIWYKVAQVFREMLK